MAEKQRLASRRRHQAEQHFDRGTLARSVGAQEAKDFTATHLERQAAHGDLFAEDFAQAPSLDGEVVNRGWLVHPQDGSHGTLSVPWALDTGFVSWAFPSRRRTHGRRTLPWLPTTTSR